MQSRHVVGIASHRGRGAEMGARRPHSGSVLRAGPS